MKAARIHRFGPPEVIIIEDVPCPIPATREVLVRIAAAGVGPWGRLIREGKSKVSPPPPLTRRLNTISELLDRGKLLPQVGTALPLAEVRIAHEMLAGAPHKRGKIVLRVAD